MSTPNAPRDTPTDPGLAKSPEGTVQADQHIGSHGELVLPDVVPIVNPATATPFGLWLNRWWIRTHFLMRGVAGTGAEWFTFIVGAAAQYPKVSVFFLVVGTIFTEENFSEHPIMTNFMKYAMTSYDPDAAEKIFAEKPVEHDPIGKAAKKAVETATKEYMDSSEYLELQDEIAQDVQRQTRRKAYLAAGMTEDVKAVDEEIAAALAARKQARLKKEAEKAPVEVAPPVAPPVVRETVQHQWGGSSEAPVEEETPVESTPIKAPEDEAPPEEEPAPAKEGRKRRQQDPTKKLLRDATDLLISPPPGK